MTIRISGPRRRARWRGVVVGLIIAAIAVLIALIPLALMTDFLVDWLWFSAVGYLLVFWTTIAAEAEVFAAVFVATAVILRFLYQVPYGANDPLYDKDIAFYLFSLPAYVVIKNWMMLTLFLSALFAGAVYWVHGDIEYGAHRRSLSPTAIAHGSVLLGCFFAVKAWSYALDRYLLLYGDNGVVVGASYTDIHVELPILWVLIGLSIVAAFAAWANLPVRTYRLPAAAAVLVFGGSFVLSGVVPGLFQRLFVKPNELEWEKPYIERNIAWTRQAYKRHQITAKPIPAAQDLTVT